MARILVADDERDICRALEFLLVGEGYNVTTVASGEAAVEALRSDEFDIVITDLKMEKLDGIGVLEEAKKLSPQTAVILMTAFASVESAVDAMKKGALDYIVKPFINDEIRLIVRRALEQMRLKSENLALRRQVSQHREQCKDIVFVSSAMQKLLEMVDNIAATRSNVLLLGESGTGKSMIAELLHCCSPRKEKPFITVNCTAIPETLLESELFGYRKGAFTGAVTDKAGLILVADGGTLFLDEIGDMPPALQAKLLKVLESGDVTPLGDTKSRHADVRLITATNQDLEEKLKNGTFREDLYYRINVIEMTVPSLRDRRDDILPLVEHFIARFSDQNRKDIAGLSEEAEGKLLDYHWPGNVRELANVIERAVVLCPGGTIETSHLPVKLDGRADATTGSLKDMVGEYEKSAILDAFNTMGRDKEATARALGIDLATLYRKMKKLGIET